MPAPKKKILPSELYPIWPPRMSQVSAKTIISQSTAIWLL